MCDLSLKDFSHLQLKTNTDNCPLWITPTGHIFLDTSLPSSASAMDFLIAISEPHSRPEFVHEYIITDYSLYAAVSVGLDVEDILSALDRLFIKRIRDATAKCGKVRLILDRGQYFIESHHPDVINEFISDVTVRACINTTQITTTTATQHVFIPGTATISQSVFSSDQQQLRNLLDDTEERREEEETRFSNKQVIRYEVLQVSILRERSHELDTPLVEEYDFRNDSSLKPIGMRLKATTTIRHYQEKALSKMFSSGRARSGLIVLPCGAGKTLVGINATCILDRPTFVLATNNVALDQWREQYLTWSTIDESMIGVLTGETKDEVRPIMLSTYSMMAHAGKGAEATRILENICSQEWGLLIFDEVHVAPAESFRRIIGQIKAHCMLGLSATLVREDMKILDLNYLIGPKIYEADWLFLRSQGYLANPKCCEVLCPMSREFYKEYLTASARKRNLLFTMNPNKIRCCEFLMRYHESRGDKILVFSDNLFTLHWYAKLFQRPYIDGKTPGQERIHWINLFKQRGKVNTLFISKVGDNSIDLPECNVIIQVSAQFGSRRQEAQRLGRILRPKKQTIGEFNAFFYSLVSRDTRELYFSSKRQQFLMNQAFAYETRVFPHFEGYDESVVTAMATLSDELALLAEVLRASDHAGDTEKNPGEDTQGQTKDSSGKGRKSGSGSMSSGKRRHKLFVNRSKRIHKDD
ncbi:hypothetical protein GEMRC1_002835 [Eukaryota sp. GEM-RC1]